MITRLLRIMTTTTTDQAFPAMAERRIRTNLPPPLPPPSHAHPHPHPHPHTQPHHPHPHPHPHAPTPQRRFLPLPRRLRLHLRFKSILLSSSLLVFLLLPPLLLFTSLALPDRSPLPPPELELRTQQPPCGDSPDGYTFHPSGVCAQTCGKICFPRVRGVCFGRSQVTICDGQHPIPEEIANAWGGLPTEMRFYLEKPRTKLPVRHGACPGWNASNIAQPIMKDGGNGARWIRGLQMVADLSFMPTGRVGPNPHHEAEKVVPAIIFSRLEHFRNSSLYWFADPEDPMMISKWSRGLLDVFADVLNVQYVKPVGENEAPVCFEDAVLFAGITNSAYMPDTATHEWFRGRVLAHCGIPAVAANTPVREAVIIHRPNSTRNLANYEDVKRVIEEHLRIPVKMAVPGPWDFCDQVQLVAEADFLLTPHGSQNANLITIRPGAAVIEVFPLLYYVDWYGHYLHSAHVSHHELFGTWPSDRVRMPLLMRVYAYLYGWKNCFFVRRCMNYGKSQKIYVDLNRLKSLLQKLTDTCQMVVRGSHCTAHG